MSFHHEDKNLGTTITITSVPNGVRIFVTAPDGRKQELLLESPLATKVAHAMLSLIKEQAEEHVEGVVKAMVGGNPDWN